MLLRQHPRGFRLGSLLALLSAAGCTTIPAVTPADFLPHPAVASREFRANDSVEIHANEPAMDPDSIEPGDLFDRIRDGFRLADVRHPSVEQEVAWYANHPDYLDRTFRRSERYLHYVVGELEARGMPLELALLPVVESAYNPVAYSRARAAGLWQFIPGTGVRYGLKQNWYYDGRRDVIESTRAALDYLTFLSNEFDGDWLLAIAAYNAGEATVARQVAINLRANRPIDFFSLALPRETRAYVPKLLAMRRIVANPMAHNLQFAPIADRPYFAMVHTGGQIQLDVAQKLVDLPEEEFVALNPGFKHGVTDPEGPHRLLVPVDRSERLMAGLSSLPPVERVRVVSHRVRPGETLGAIARRYDVSIEALRTANKLRGNTIHTGQELVVTAYPGKIAAMREVSATNRAAPQAPLTATVPAEALVAGPESQKSGSHTVKQGDTLWSIAQSHGITLDALAAQNEIDTDAPLAIGRKLEIPASATLAASEAATPRLQPLTYTVQRGDTLSRIARTFKVAVDDILGWNKLRSAHDLKPGQRLVMYVEDRRRLRG
ncbi:MAG: LysM peptidoglycan-binding domain-containing protein [Steroidobacteraceae bacterium]